MDTRTVLDPHGLAERLPDSVTIEHTFANGQRVSVTFEDGYVAIVDNSVSPGRLLIEPVVSNSIRIRGERR